MYCWAYRRVCKSIHRAKGQSASRRNFAVFTLPSTVVRIYYILYKQTHSKNPIHIHAQYAHGHAASGFCAFVYSFVVMWQTPNRNPWMLLMHNAFLRSICIHAVYDSIYPYPYPTNQQHSQCVDIEFLFCSVWARPPMQVRQINHSCNFLTAFCTNSGTSLIKYWQTTNQIMVKVHRLRTC